MRKSSEKIIFLTQYVYCERSYATTNKITMVLLWIHSLITKVLPTHNNLCEDPFSSSAMLWVFYTVNQ
jgi:hypothetical protein